MTDTNFKTSKHKLNHILFSKLDLNQLIVILLTIPFFLGVLISCSPNSQLELKSIKEPNSNNESQDNSDINDPTPPPTVTPPTTTLPSTPNPNPNPEPPTPTTSSTLPPVNPPNEKPIAWLPLSWEEKNPNRNVWSEYTFNVINEFGSAIVNESADIGRFCPKYSKLSTIQKINVIGQIISAMTKFESSYNPLSRMAENMGTDPVTGNQVHSEGLLQLSYQDTLHYKFCNFDWKADKPLHAKNPKDPRITILDPYKNLYCGIRILNQQVSKHKNIIIGKGAYWAVIKSDSNHHRISEITTMVKALPICQ